MGERELNDSYLTGSRKKVAAFDSDAGPQRTPGPLSQGVKQPLDGLNDIERAKKSSRLPVVFSAAFEGLPLPLVRALPACACSGRQPGAFSPALRASSLKSEYDKVTIILIIGRVESYKA